MASCHNPMATATSNQWGRKEEEEEKNIEKG